MNINQQGINMEKRLNDKRVKKYLVLDTETIGVDDRGVFDIGYIICDKDGNKFIKRSYLVREVFTDMARMKNAYYFSKYPNYLEGLNDGSFELQDWCYILSEMYGLIKKYDVKVLSAYNLQFDLGAIAYTNKNIRNKDIHLFDNLEKLCIWGMATETICQQKTFRKQVIANNLLTASGKFLSTSAETVYKYLLQDWTYKEEHTGLEDVEIEVNILARAFRQHKRMSKGIVAQPFRAVAI